MHSSMPHFPIAYQITFLGTRSNAFSRSTKAKYNFLFLAKYFSCNYLRMNIALVVPHPGMKPNCMSWYLFHHFFMSFSGCSTLHGVNPNLKELKKLLNSFHDMIKEFNSSVVISYQSITFPFIDVDDKIIFPVSWDGTISFHVISKVSNQLYTSITGSLHHFSNFSWGSSSFGGGKKMA